MKDVFADVADPNMSRATEPSSVSQSSSASQSSGSGDGVEGHVCPFCGLTREVTETFDPASPCPRCTLADTPQTRSATKSRIGPWHVRQVRNPWAPGMGFDTLVALVKRGQVTKDSIVRGPTTHQLWKRAAEIKGLSREFGLCFSCGAEIDTQANLCPHCNRLQEPPVNPDVLVDGREGMVAPPAAAPTPAPQPIAQAPAPQPRRTPVPPRPAPPEPQREEPPHIEIGSGGHTMSPEEMLAADEAELARQITSRPPQQSPPRPPRPLRQRLPGTDDALLTPQELAQAFQLGFSSPAAPKQKGRSKSAIVVVILLLLGGSIAALLSLRPDFRESSSQWIAQASFTVEGWFASIKPPKLPVIPQLPDSATLAEDKAMATTQKAREPIVIAPPSAPEGKSVETSESTVIKPSEPLHAFNDSRVTVTPSAQPASAPAAPAVAEAPTPPAPAPTSAPAVPIPPPPTVSAQPTPSPVPQPEKVAIAEPQIDPADKARMLWRKAIDAERNQDYVEAVSCYEQIEKLPSDVHPSGLDVHLDQARKLVK